MGYICEAAEGSSGSPIFKAIRKEEVINRNTKVKCGIVIAGIHRGGFDDNAPSFCGFNYGTLFSEIRRDITSGFSPNSKV